MHTVCAAHLTVQFSALQCGQLRRFLQASRMRLKMPARCARSRRALRKARRKRTRSSGPSSTRAHALQIHCGVAGAARWVIPWRGLQAEDGCLLQACAHEACVQGSGHA